VLGSRHVRLLAIVAALTVLGGASATRAAERAEEALGRRLTVSSGATCIAHRQVLSLAAPWLGDDVLPAGLTVRIEGDPHDPRSVAIHTSRSGRERVRAFHALPRDCHEANALVGLALALALDASALGELLAVEGPSAVLALHRWAASAELLAGWGMLFDLSLGPRVGLAYGLDWLELKLALLIQASPNVAIGKHHGRVDVTLLAAEPGLCFVGRLARSTDLRLCSGLIVGQVRARGRNFATSDQAASGLFLAAQSALGLDFHLGVPLGLELGLVLPFRAPALRVDTGGEGFDQRAPARVAGALALGPRWRF